MVRKTTLYLTEELRTALDRAARRTGRPRADIVREALAAHLEELRPSRPRSVGAGEDPTVSARTSEEWLRGRWDGGGTE